MNQNLRNELENQLRILKTNREKVPLDLLKTKYRAGYEALCDDIKNKTSEYALQLIFSDMPIHKDYVSEALPIVEETLNAYELARNLSIAAFSRHSIEEITSIALEFKMRLLEALEPLFQKHLGLYLSPDCLDKKDAVPEVYCIVNNCIYRDGKWVAIDTLKTDETSASTTTIPRISA